jgi:phosphoribosyl-ATP pyrophosphohydrolase
MAPKNIIDSLYDVILDRKRAYLEGSGTAGSGTAGSDSAGSDSAGSGIAGSYTCSLFKKGRDEILKKIGEEAVEVIIAAKSQDAKSQSAKGQDSRGQNGRGQAARDHDSQGQDSRRVIEEICDLQYHLLVLMADEGITPDDIRRELLNRFGRAAPQ